MSRSPDRSPRWPSDRRRLALRADDFEHHRPSRATADLRRRMDAWALGVIARLAALGVDATAHAVDDHAAAQVQFKAQRAAPTDMARLVLSIDKAGVRAGLALPATQAHAASARLSDPAGALEIAAAFDALPEQFTIGEAGDRATVEAPRATLNDFRALLDRIERAPGNLWVGWTVPRELALEHASMLDDQLEDAIAALAQLFAILAVDASSEASDPARGRGRRFSGRRGKGTPTKDHERAPTKDDERAPTKEDERAPTKEDERAPTKEDERYRDRGREAGTRARWRGRDRELDREGESEPELESSHDAPVAARRAELKPPVRPAARRRQPKGMPDAIERGARVTVLKGPFSGKVGVVHDLDGKGGARVMLGLLAVRLEVMNLMRSVDGRRRPVLSSSHRRPTPARS